MKRLVISIIMTACVVIGMLAANEYKKCDELRKYEDSVEVGESDEHILACVLDDVRWMLEVVEGEKADYGCGADFCDNLYSIAYNGRPMYEDGSCDDKYAPEGMHYDEAFSISEKLEYVREAVRIYTCHLDDDGLIEIFDANNRFTRLYEWSHFI